MLTRDVELHRRGGARSLLIASDDYEEQVRQVISTLDLRDFSVLSRCAECNTLLLDADKESVFLRVPPYVYLTQERFAICPTCNRVYWQGAHTREMFEKTAKWTSPL
jgi:uncharacterized protein with PIN domain